MTSRERSLITKVWHVKKNRNGNGNETVLGFLYIPATVVLAHSQGWLRRLAGRAWALLFQTSYNYTTLSKQSKYSNRTVTAVVYNSHRDLI